VREIKRREATLEHREAKLRRRAREIEETGASEFLSRLAEADKEVSGLIADLQRAPESKLADTTKRRIVELAKQTRDATVRETERNVSQGMLRVGSSVRIAKFGTTGEIVAIRANEIEVRTGTMSIRVPASEVSLAGAAGSSSASGVAAQPGSSGRGRRQGGGQAAKPKLRLPTNTLDLRGARVVEGLERMEKFMDDAILRGEDAVFVLHGHGTGVLKTAVRQALANSPYVSDSGPAESDQGGDAFTVATLRD
jgi:DNA mismatch repair protein MutS2